MITGRERRQFDLQYFEVIALGVSGMRSSPQPRQLCTPKVAAHLVLVTFPQTQRARRQGRAGWGASATPAL